MQASNALQQMLIAKHAIPDPGDGKTLVVDRDRFYYTLEPAGTETRILDAPPQEGLVGHIGCTEAQTVVVTVKDSSGATTGIVTFTAAGQWIGLVSCELTAGVFSWQATDVYGCTTTVQTAQNWSASVAAGTMTTLDVATGITCPSFVGTSATIPSLVAAAVTATNITLATNITALTGVFKSINCSTGMTAAALTATGIVVGTGGVNCSAARRVDACQTGMTGGTAASVAQAITSQHALLAFTASTNNFYGLPAPALGVEVNVINRVGSTGALVANNATQSIQGATSVSIATSNAAGSAFNLICDGTHWWKQAI